SRTERRGRAADVSNLVLRAAAGRRLGRARTGVSMSTQQQKVFPKPVDWDDLYPGRFLKAADLKGKKVTLRISEVNLEELIGDKGPQVKGVVGFEKTEKQLALNKANGICLKEMFGKKVQEWVGKRVTVFAGTWNGEECLRIWGSPDLAEEREITVSL